MKYLPSSIKTLFIVFSKLAFEILSRFLFPKTFKNSVHLTYLPSKILIAPISPLSSTQSIALSLFINLSFEAIFDINLFLISSRFTVTELVSDKGILIKDSSICLFVTVVVKVPKLKLNTCV